MDDESVIEISKANWKRLKIMNLSMNYFGNRGMKHLRLANW
jgi:hypothetical protein